MWGDLKSETRRFPELARFETLERRRKAWKKAWRELFKPRLTVWYVIIGG
jgi:hypothetical protein